MKQVRPLELLAPARNLDCGIAAIDHGADAVYIGADRFGARSAACNPLDDIARLVEYAHQFMARVYVTVNTILYDNELASTERLINHLYEIGVDAILVQDMSILRMKLPPIALHASTQTDNRSAAKVKWLSELGMERVVLARELSLNEIRSISTACPDVELEAFVHGALCVSYSGQCYASCFCKQRSANRGECAQMCRLRYSVFDSQNQEVVPPAHYLSLRDMCRIDYLKDMADAGITSFKIEGRLKDVDYVKNVVAAYSMALDDIVEKSGGKYKRQSIGKTDIAFKPDLNKSFNRQFTSYYIDGERSRVASFKTPKSLGQFIGRVKDVGRNWFTVSTTVPMANGDGLCYFIENQDKSSELKGIRANKVDGNKSFPLSMPRDLSRGMMLYRNHDAAFMSILSKQTARRSISLDVNVLLDKSIVTLEMAVQGHRELKVSQSISIEMQVSRQPQMDNIKQIVSKLGGTAFQLGELTIDNRLDSIFIPKSMIVELRRSAVTELSKVIASKSIRHRDRTQCNYESVHFVDDTDNPVPWSSNIANAEAAAFYQQMGSQRIERAFELDCTKRNARRGPLMQCRYCLRFELGYCVARGGKKPEWKEPLHLISSEGNRFRLEFDCRHCQMNVWSDE